VTRQTHDRDSLPSANRKRSATQFLTALAIGTAASALVWIAGWDTTWGTLGAVLVPLAKVIVAFRLRRHDAWKPAAAGLFASIGVGFLVFFSVCALNFKTGPA
jgi:hypothetical protein